MHTHATGYYLKPSTAEEIANVVLKLFRVLRWEVTVVTGETIGQASELEPKCSGFKHLCVETPLFGLTLIATVIPFKAL